MPATVLFLTVAGLGIWLESGGTVFFQQKRLGKHKRIFCIWKLRTMSNDSETKKRYLWQKNEAPFPMFKLSDDPRYTRIGKFLSHAGIDEIPQIFNILAGEMSFVGPRPLPVSEAGKLPANWNFRYQVLPGITSEWAVSDDRYNSLSTWKKLELATLQQGSVRYDLQLLWRTIRYLLKF